MFRKMTRGVLLVAAVCLASSYLVSKVAKGKKNAGGIFSTGGWFSKKPKKDKVRPLEEAKAKHRLWEIITQPEYQDVLLCSSCRPWGLIVHDTGTMLKFNDAGEIIGLHNGYSVIDVLRANPCLVARKLVPEYKDKEPRLIAYLEENGLVLNGWQRIWFNFMHSKPAKPNFERCPLKKSCDN